MCSPLGRLAASAIRGVGVNHCSLAGGVASPHAASIWALVMDWPPPSRMLLVANSFTTSAPSATDLRMKARI